MGLDYAVANTNTPTGAKRIGIVDAVVARQRGGDQRQHPVPSVRQPRRAAEVEVVVDKFPQSQVLGKAGWQEQAGIGHHGVVVKDNAEYGI